MTKIYEEDGDVLVSIQLGAVQYGHNGDKRICKESALAVLLYEDIVILNYYWYIKDFPVEAKEAVRLLVRNDNIFAIGHGPYIPLHYHDIPELFEMYLQDKEHGPMVWVIKKCGYMPRPELFDEIMNRGIFNLLAMDLKPN